MIKVVALSRLKVRASRRHHRSRMIARALRSEKFAGMNETDKIRWAVRQYDYLKSCSCWMCGNSRKYRGEPTFQEMKQDEAVQRDGFQAR